MAPAPTDLDQALEHALTGYNADQRKRALAVIETGQWRKHPESPRAWIIPSASGRPPYIVIVDTGPGYCHAWCPCPASGRCYHGATAIMLHISAEHMLIEPPVYSDDPPGADSSPMSELQRRALADPFAGIPNADDLSGNMAGWL